MATDTPHTAEQMVDVGRGVQLCVETFGASTDPALLLIAGLAQQHLSWPESMCEALAARGFYVIRFDNRDIGRSTKISTPAPTPLQLLRRRFSREQYELSDMADDTAGLLRALNVESAHVVGISMGGMIAQTLAFKYPSKVRSLVSIMSTTGHPKVGTPARSTWLKMAKPPSKDREASIARNVDLFRHIGSHGFPFDEEGVRALAAASFDRGHDPRGVGRQLAAIMKSGDRTSQVRQIKAPTLVIHGDRDRMVHQSGGRAVADAIAGSRHETIVGMGHDLPAGAQQRLTDLIGDHAAINQEISA
jgi:pimeloyl-ACP methyl ester carboxylesterase